jgi:Pyridoxamine 5'-phosphate oxidase
VYGQHHQAASNWSSLGMHPAHAWRTGARRCWPSSRVGWRPRASGGSTAEPVGFLWDGGASLLTYSQAEARRLANIRRQPLVSPNFDSNGDDIVVLTGTAEILTTTRRCPAAPRGWRSTARPSKRFGSVLKFAERFSFPGRIHLTRVRGF